MNKLIQIILFVAFAFGLSFSVQSQTGNKFKNTNRQLSAATAATNLSYKKINGSTGLKSANTGNSNQTFMVSKNLKKPDLVQNQAPRFFEKEKSGLKSASSLSLEEQFYSFHDESKEITSLSNPRNELRIIQKNMDGQGISHIKAQQFYKGIKIYGAESYVHIGSKKDIFNGFIYHLPDNIETTPTIPETDALNVVTKDLETKTILKDLSKKEKKILNYKSPKANLIIYENKLAYEIIVRPNFIQQWKYFIDANNGSVIHHFNNTHTNGPATATAFDLNNVLRTIDTYLEDDSYFLLNASEKMYDERTQEGYILTLDANNTSTVDLEYSTITSTNNTWSDRTAVSAHYNSTATYRYFESTFGRNSLSGDGGNIISFINVANEDGSSLQNAFWNGQAAFYGNGGPAFKPLAGALDVIAHELGHGVISNTANLEYYGQSGAINESYSDIFGAMVDREDWLIGEDISKPAFFPSGAMRNMSDPHNGGSSLNDRYWQPKNISEMYMGERDNGGVHINSGISNYAYYLFATAISKEKAEQVFYHALTNYLTSKSQFIDLRFAVIQSAKDLYGENSAEAGEAANAFDEVGIFEEAIVDYSQDYEMNPGNEYLLTYIVDTTSSNTLYKLSPNNEANTLSATNMRGPVSVSDNGALGVFVAADNRIKVISTDHNNIQEYYLTNDAFFANVAISKDGKRMAAISTGIDTSIYVFDFAGEQWAKYKLYNPTTSDNGSHAGGVLFADAIQFDHTGEYLIYDAYNQLNSTEEDHIAYWDIGFIKVWDNSTNEFGDGRINKLYGSLSENVSIGNPTFSSNSPYIIAFEYLNNETNEYAILGANLISGEIDLITNNTIIGYPSFSKDDDRIAFSALNLNDQEVVASIALSSNKITGIGSASVLVNNAKWPVFFSVGKRVLELIPISNFSAGTKSGEAPLNVQFMDLSINNPNKWSWSFEGGTPASSNEQNPKIIYNEAGTYQVSLTTSNDAGENNVTKTGYISVLLNTSSTEFETEKLVSFYPNPTSDILNIDTDKQFELWIYSASGTLLIQSNNKKSVNLTSLNSGLYILKIKIEDKILTNKIIKQ